MYLPLTVALIYQHDSKSTHPIPIEINNALPCIDSDLDDAPGDTHLIRILADIGSATNAGKFTLCYMLSITINMYILTYFISRFIFEFFNYLYCMFITFYCYDVCVRTSDFLLS